MPPRCRQVLEALLESVRVEITGQRCLDLTSERFGAQWFDAHDITWRDADRLAGDDRFALVICEVGTIHSGLHHVETDGAVLVFAASGGPPSTWLEDHDITSRASVRSAEGDWHLCGRRSAAETTYVASVVIACRDDARFLAPLLLQLADDSSGIHWELVVADRGSFDETGALLRSLQGDVRVLHRPRLTQPADALDAALHACAGPVAVVLDPHVLPEPGWLGSLLEAIDAHPDTLAFGGCIHNAPDDDTVVPLFAVRTAAYRGRGGLDPTLPIAHGLADLFARLGRPLDVPGLAARMGAPIELPQAG